MHNRIGDDIILNLLHRQEDQIHQSADAIDTKAGLVLAAAAFLAMQPAYLLALPRLSNTAAVVQVISFLLLLAAVWFAILILKVTGYPTPGIPESWRDEQVMSAPAGSTENDIHGTILWEAVNQARKRVEEATEINEGKTGKLLIAQVLTVLSLIANVAVIVLTYLSSRA
jgi:hypothetical protein